MGAFSKRGKDSIDNNSHFMLNDKRILIVDDEFSVRELLRKVLTREGCFVETAPDGVEALAVAHLGRFDIVITDLNMPRMGGLELLAKFKEKHPYLTIMILTGYGTIEMAVQAIKEGAYDFIEKPIVPKDLVELIRKATERKKVWTENISVEQERRKNYRFENIIGYTPKMHEVFNEIKEVAKHDIPVLIVGENGTGKELVANAIHHRSARKNNPYIKINCGALAEDIVESRLFGHERGAFTGAIARHNGVFEMADKGTLLLDEIGELPLPIQIKLLRILETFEFYRVGGTEMLKSDFRFISATNKDIVDAVAKKEFREDLYYRINTFVIELPPLRDRRADIPLLAEHFLKRSCRQMKKNIDGMSNKVMTFFMKYEWPGNVRQLAHVIDRSVVHCKKNKVSLGNLPPQIIERNSENNLSQTKTLADIESGHILNILSGNQWNMKRAAESLGIARGTLYKKMKKYDIVKPSAN